MSLSESVFLEWFPMEYTMIIGTVMIALVVLSSMKLLFGTYSPSNLLRNYKQSNQLSETYHKMFESRDLLLYHIGWAKSNGEHEQANRMIQDLKALDKEIDNMELKFKMKKK